MSVVTRMTEAITENWLKAVGFKWHELDRQIHKHWLLWLGDAVNDGSTFASIVDVGIEVAPAWWENAAGGRVEPAGPGAWNCWLRSDFSHRYGRFIHLRHLHAVGDLVKLAEALTGQAWDPANHVFGNMYRPDRVAYHRAELERLDLRIARNNKWAEVERDDTRGRALPEHLEAHEKARGTDGGAA